MARSPERERAHRITDTPSLLSHSFISPGRGKYKPAIIPAKNTAIMISMACLTSLEE